MKIFVLILLLFLSIPYANLILVDGKEEIGSLIKTIGDIDSVLVSYGFFDGDYKVSGDTIFVSTNSRYRFGELSVVGNSFYSGKILEKRVGFDGEFSLSAVSRILQKIESFYQVNGYPFVKIEVDGYSRNRERKLVDLNLKIDSGDFVRVESIKFNGDLSSRDDILIRESRLETPTPFNKNLFDLASEYIYSTELFKFKPHYKIYKISNNYGVIFDIEEELYNSVDGMFGYASSEKGDDNLFGYIDLEFRNLFGTFRKSKIYWQRLKSSNEEIEVSYSEPWLYTIPISTSLKFTQLKEDSLYLERGYSALFSYKIDQHYRVDFGWSYNRVFPVDKESNDQIESSESSGYNFTLSYRNSIFKSPFRGRHFNINLFIDDQRKSFLDSDQSNRLFNLRVGGGYVEPMGPLSFSTKLRFDHLFFNSSPEDLDLLTFGGINSMRGYREDFIATSSYFTLQNNLYLKLGDGSYLYLMGDMAIFAKKRELFIEDSNFLYAIGTGLKFPVKTGGIEIIYAFPIDKGFGESVIHAKLSTLF